ncbi:MAG: hypothetical protein P1P90_04060 [Patescibacteria group bacterium]|nr:hypothetical protein [Patescibacteria group bacterium]
MELHQLDTYLKAKLSPKNYDRSTYTAQLMLSVANKFDFDPKLGQLAGTLHLVSRQMSYEAMVSYVEAHDRNLLKRIPKECLGIYHLTGPASAWFAFEVLDERSDDVFRGIRDHTFLYRDPSNLAKSLHIAGIIAAADQNDPRTAVLVCDFLSGRMEKVLKTLNGRDVRSLEKTGANVRRLARITNPDHRGNNS